MPAKTERQRKAAGADLQRVREGKKPRTFEGMSEAELSRMASKPDGHTKSKKSTAAKRRRHRRSHGS